MHAAHAQVAATYGAQPCYKLTSVANLEDKMTGFNLFEDFIPSEATPPFTIPPVPIPLVQPPIETVEEETATFESCLDECLHGIAWECVAQHSRDLSREMFCALISSNPKKFILDKETINVLRKKLFKKNNDPNWSEPCEPIDSK
ncbi:hypothetical protein AVEN_62512-1 [Araneus ventricosus]|uniref:Uncharacterized protein n=1 Tax=Araneus ventricosus TaxID=182803 RepID=A0A4Y2KLX9_ARAVE|nr:hypothetical protein AVEN_62512-1 [Araneus ventricosus]